MHPFLRGLKPTLHISHRGGALLSPENTLFAFERAQREFRTDMIETDVHLSKDGELFLSHDPTVDRCTDGSGAIEQLTSTELRRLDAGYRFTLDGRTFPFRGQGIGLPTLAEALRALPTMRFNVDLKATTPGIEKAFAEVVRRERAVDRLCAGSEYDDAAARLHEVMPEACLFYPRQALTELVLTVRWGEPPASDDRFTVLDMPLELDGARLIDRPFVERVHGLGKWINVWTIDDEAQMRELVADGVGGIMTDRPDLLRAVLT